MEMLAIPEGPRNLISKFMGANQYNDEIFSKAISEKTLKDADRAANRSRRLRKHILRQTGVPKIQREAPDFGKNYARTSIVPRFEEPFDDEPSDENGSPVQVANVTLESGSNSNNNTTVLLTTRGRRERQLRRRTSRSRSRSGSNNNEDTERAPMLRGRSRSARSGRIAPEA
jgi:hypothetical protein